MRRRTGAGTGHGTSRASGSSAASRDGSAVDQRALDAMAVAASRARRATSATTLEDGIDETGPRRLVARATTSGRPRDATGSLPARQPRTPPTRAGSPRGRAGAPVRDARRRPAGVGTLGSRRRPTAILVAVLLVLVAVAGIAVGLSLRSPTPPTSRAVGAARSPKSSGGAPPPKSAGGSAHPSSPSTSSEGATGGVAPRTTTSTEPASAARTGGPHIASVFPASASAGQTLVIAGSGLYSADGKVVALIDGSPAPTRCRTETSCTVTVPDLGSRATNLTVAIVTTSGTSNALAFSYE